jgi:hypothetical protein
MDVDFSAACEGKAGVDQMDRHFLGFRHTRGRAPAYGADQI